LDYSDTAGPIGYNSGMIKKTLVFSAIAVAVLVALFLAFGPAIVEKRLNPVRDPGPYEVSAEAAKLHEKLMVADLHADSLILKRDLLKRSSRGHVDIPRLIAGNVALQSFTVVTKACATANPDRNGSRCDHIRLLAMASMWPRKTWDSLLERALYQADKLQGFTDRSGGKFTFVKSSKELWDYITRRMQEPEITAGFLGLEGAHALEGDAANVDVLYDAGFRMIGPAHFFDNEMAGSQHGIEKYGLTEEGRKMIARMAEKRIICDLAHSSEATIDDILAMENRPPIVVSHTGVKGTCDNNRNLSDEYLRRIAAAGGVIGIGYWKTATCGEDVGAVVKAIRHAVDVAGIDHVALGSDYDGTITAPFDTSGLALITQELMNSGFTENEIGKIMGGNTIVFLVRNLPDE